MTRLLAGVLVALLIAGCGAAVKRPETPRLRAAYEHLAFACEETSHSGPEGDEVLLKTWLAVHGRYPYETNLLRAIPESLPDANGLYYGELTVREGVTISSCRARADRIAGIGR